MWTGLRSIEAVTTVVGTHAFKSDLRGVEDFFYACREYLFDLARLTATKKIFPIFSFFLLLRIMRR